MRTMAVRPLVFVVLAFSVMLIGCTRQKPSATQVGTTPSMAVSVTSSGCPSLEVQQGMQVVWTNKDSRAHSLVGRMTAPTEASFGSGTLQPGDSFAFTFINAGKWEYGYGEAGGLTGTITVK